MFTKTKMSLSGSCISAKTQVSLTGFTKIKKKHCKLNMSIAYYIEIIDEA